MKKKPLTPEQTYAQLATRARRELHRGLDQLCDDHMADFLKLLVEGYVLVANVHPYRETKKELPEGVVGEILGESVVDKQMPTDLVDSAGNPLVRN
jgi:hypothetical protein